MAELGAEAVLAPVTAAAVSVYEPFERTFWLRPVMTPEQKAAMLQARVAIEVAVLDGGEDDCNYPPVSTFEELNVLPPYAFTALAAMGIQAPLPIQSQALPIVLGGHDLIGIAKTGSGKTLAFLLPALVHIESSLPLLEGALTPIVLVLAPTRELVMQIMGEAKKLIGSSKGMSMHPEGIGAASIIGGMQKQGQLVSMMQGSHILVATPGRLMDHVRNGEISFQRVTYFVLDEADRMLDGGFQGQVEEIAGSIRPDRHMLFFSATWPKEVQDLAEKHCCGAQKPVRIAVGQQSDGVATTRQDIKQEVIVFDQWTWEGRDNKKMETLYVRVKEVMLEPANKALVFVSRKDICDGLARALWNEGVAADSMHGGRAQSIRLEVLESFRQSKTRLLVTTDVMGRGLDIPDISHVFLYDMSDIEDYIHRIGRTARGPSGTGTAITFFEYDDKWPNQASELIAVLEKSGSQPPEHLRKIANQVLAGTRVKETGGGGGPASKKQKWNDGGWGGNCGGSSWDGW